MLLHLPQLLTPDEVQQAQALLSTAPWGDGRKGAGEQAKQVKNNEQLDHDCDAARTIRQMVLQGLDRSPLFFSATLPKRVFPPRLNRYGGDSNYYEYDALGRLSCAADVAMSGCTAGGAGVISVYSYDSSGNRLTSWDRNAMMNRTWSYPASSSRTSRYTQPRAAR